jgi:hypothetical protein
MKRLLLLLAGALAVVAPSAGQALAVSPHLKGHNPVLFTDNVLTLTATVSSAGLGNFNTLQDLSASAQPTADCVNPGTESIGRRAKTPRRST